MTQDPKCEAFAFRYRKIAHFLKLKRKAVQLGVSAHHKNNQGFFLGYFYFEHLSIQEYIYVSALVFECAFFINLF